ncbi:hypothetical protein Syun_009060 [Stephania yunnanensis]|uniref:Uncharacterized protein n=1 Tax=Stephania yunnanensis TaxID=152371 RepID=A0AAP0KDR5_9MAGN
MVTQSTADIDEKAIRMEKPEDLVMALAEAKADGIISRLQTTDISERKDNYSGGCAATVGSVVVTNLKTRIRKDGWDRVEIYFHDIPDDIIDNLIEEGHVLYVAGGLIIEHEC